MARKSIELHARLQSLVDTVESLGRRCVLSGPIPAMFKSDEHFSRLLSLNSWMKNYSLATEAEFINNFNNFWTMRDLFKADGLHPNMKGVGKLTKHFIDFIAFKLK